MGVINGGILGGFSGKVGGVVGTSWKGIAVMKAMPQSVANPKTAPQVEQRNALTAVVALATILLSLVIKPLWDRFASKMSGYNAFVQANIDRFPDGVFTTPSAFVISMGKMAKTLISSAVAVNNASTITLNWVNDAGEGYKLASDLAYAVVFNFTEDYWICSTTNTLRSSGSIVLDTPFALSTSDSLYCYLAFKRADGTIVSETGYLNKLVTA
jgi:hypothetical protein